MSNNRPHYEDFDPTGVLSKASDNLHRQMSAIIAERDSVKTQLADMKAELDALKATLADEAYRTRPNANPRKPPIAGAPTRDAVETLQQAVSRTISDVDRYDSLTDHDLSREIKNKLTEIQRLAADLAALAEGKR